MKTHTLTSQKTQGINPRVVWFLKQGAIKTFKKFSNKTI